MPAVVYNTRSTSNGVAEYSVSGRGPRKSVFSRHAICSLLKLSLVIWSAGE
jgi:hypothetical protein